MDVSAARLVMRVCACGKDAAHVPGRRPLAAFVADLRALTRGEVRPHDSVRSDPWPVPR